MAAEASGDETWGLYGAGVKDEETTAAAEGTGLGQICEMYASVKKHIPIATSGR